MEYIALHFAPNGFARGTATNDRTTKSAQMEPIIRQRGLFQILFTSISHSRLLAGGWILSCFESCVDTAVSTMHGSTSQASTYCCLETAIKRLSSAPPEFCPIIVSACSWTWVAAMECVICSRRQATWDSQIAKNKPKKLNNKMNNHILIPVLSKISLQTYVLTTRVIEMNSNTLQSWDTTSEHLRPPSAFTQPHKWFQSRTARSCIATLWNDFALRRRKLPTNAAHCSHICFDGMAFWCHILSNASSETYMRYFAWKACAAHVANAKWLQSANEPWFNMHKGATALGSFLGGVEVVLCCCGSISLCLVDCLFSIASRTSFRKSGTPSNRLNASIVVELWVSAQCERLRL